MHDIRVFISFKMGVTEINVKRQKVSSENDTKLSSSIGYQIIKIFRKIIMEN